MVGTQVSPSSAAQACAHAANASGIHRRDDHRSTDHNRLAINPSAEGYLAVTVLHAKDLPAGDPSGSSDPYVEIHIHRPGLFRSMTWRSSVKRQTLHPTWNQVARFEGSLEDLMQWPITLRVWDYDSALKRYGLGHHDIDITRLPFSPNLSFVDIPLQGAYHGSVTYRLSFTVSSLRWAFPAMPLHASALLALRRQPPPDATRYELCRDACLRGLTHWSFRYIAVTWVLMLCGWGVFLVYLYIVKPLGG